MAKLGDIAEKVRSKNAGPFWLTIDIFCGNAASYQRVKTGLSSERIATTVGADRDQVKRFDIADLNVIKFSTPRPEVQGSIRDRDMHGASWGALIAELDIQ